MKRPRLVQQWHPRHSRQGFSVLEVMVVAAVIAAIIAIAVPYYTAYKRAACDRTAEGELEGLRLAWQSYLEDEFNIWGLMPVNISDLVGQFYGWSGTNKKCEVRVSVDYETIHAYACALKGSRPRGPDTRYAYRIRLPATLGTSGTTTMRRGLTPVLGRVDRSFDLFSPGSAHASSIQLVQSGESAGQKTESVLPITPNIGIVSESEVRDNWQAFPPGTQLRNYSAFDRTGQYVGYK